MAEHSSISLRFIRSHTVSYKLMSISHNIPLCYIWSIRCTKIELRKKKTTNHFQIQWNIPPVYVYVFIVRLCNQLRITPPIIRSSIYWQSINNHINSFSCDSFYYFFIVGENNTARTYNISFSWIKNKKLSELGYL